MVITAEKHRLIWFGVGAVPTNVQAATSDWDITPCATPDALAAQLAETQLVLISLMDEVDHDPRRLSELLDMVDCSGCVAIVLAPSHLAHASPMASRRGQFVVVADDALPMEIAARIEAAAALQPAIRNLREDVAAVRGFGAGVGQNFEQLDEEMRLAAKLQRDFLPKSLPQVGPIHFSTLFRPASWVSGDLYDVFRLDETRLGFYVADVVGHGMPAALLTMFVKKSLQTKRIQGSTYEIIAPCDALAQLNEDICEQDLTSCQFCTAMYAIVDVDKLTLQYARGGHPPALLLGPDGSISKLDAAGPLLGIFPDGDFEPAEIPLQVGDRVVVYSAGAEATFGCQADGDNGFISLLQELRPLPADEMILQLAAHINERRAVSEHDDDITIIAMDVVDS